ncbi:MAG: sigma factor-like helix-turn-helix DNA-binding protein, partial [Saprospiraceae bacterium]
EKPLTLDEIGEQLELTRERVRQIKERAIRRLRKTMRKNTTIRTYM